MDPNITIKDFHTGEKQFQFGTGGDLARIQVEISLAFRELREHKQADKWLKMAADNGDPGSQHNVGVKYLFGVMGFGQDVSKGRSYLEKAANQGLSVSQLVLAEHLIVGDRLPQDLETGHTFLAQAVSQGYQPAIEFFDSLAGKV